ncbi:hypothetical protein JG638_18415, partial [Vibrio cholerae]|nr:hypothetical protein [Vibrio cholerae]
MSHHSYFDTTGDDQQHHRHQQAQTPSAGPSQAREQDGGASAGFAAFLQRRDSGQTTP